MNRLQRLLEDIGYLAGDDVRADSAATAHVAKQLEYVKSQTYDVRYPNLKARLLIPVSNEVDNAAETITYYQWESVGMAKILANYADDLPKVNAFRREFTNKVVPMGVAYEYSIQDLRRSARTGSNLTTRQALMARRAVELRIEQIAATGNSATGLPGFTNHPNTPTVTLPNGSWDSADPLDIIEDMNFMAESIVRATRGVHTPDTLVMDLRSWFIINNRRMSADASAVTVRQAFLASSTHIQDIDFWNYLDNADAAGTGPIMVAYERNPEVLELEIPQEFEQFPPQAKGLGFEVNCHARIGGVVWYYPMAAAKAENHL